MEPYMKAVLEKSETGHKCDVLTLGGVKRYCPFQAEPTRCGTWCPLLEEEFTEAGTFIHLNCSPRANIGYRVQS